MEMIDAVRARHAVRNYQNKAIEPEKAEALQRAVEEYNAQFGLSIQLCLDDPQAFSNFLARYGNFKNVSNYFALVGPSSEGASLEKCGYCGQKLVLLAQTLGLNTCWVGLSYDKKKNAVKVKQGEKLHLVIALGYGETQGKASGSKPMSKLCRNANNEEFPAWFVAAMQASLLAPTALNHQKFLITLHKKRVEAQSLPGSYSRVDLGIVKCCFEIGAAAAGAQQGTDWDWVS
ncbi:MAG: nitroreductase [Coriobacteriales bacterium]|nr:nitroreductase [Coriobacteriales bacterium]